MRSPCSTSSTSRTQRARSILAALESYHRVDSSNIEFFQQFRLLVSGASRYTRTCSDFISPPVAFLRVGVLLMVSGECLLCCDIEFLTNHLFVYAFRPAVPPGYQGPHPTIPNPPPTSPTTDTIPGICGEPPIQGATGLYATLSMNVRSASADQVQVARWLKGVYLILRCTLQCLGYTTDNN